MKLNITFWLVSGLCAHNLPWEGYEVKNYRNVFPGGSCQKRKIIWQQLFDKLSKTRKNYYFARFRTTRVFYIYFCIAADNPPLSLYVHDHIRNFDLRLGKYKKKTENSGHVIDVAQQAEALYIPIE